MKTIILILSLVLTAGVIAQNPGYFGKYNTVSFRMLPTLDYTNDQGPQQTVINDDVLFDYGFFSDTRENVKAKKFTFENYYQVAYARILKRSLKVGGAIGFGKINLGENAYREINRDYADNLFSDNQYPNSRFLGMESLIAQRLSVEAFVEFSLGNTIIMSNIAHKFGVRYNTGKLVNRSYRAKFHDFYGNNSTLEREIKFDEITTHSEVNLNDIQFVYGFTIHKPLFDFLVLQYGVNFNISTSLITKNSRLRDYTAYLPQEGNTELLEPEVVNFMFKRAIFTNIINAEVGLIFPF